MASKNSKKPKLHKGKQSHCSQCNPAGYEQARKAEETRKFYERKGKK